MALRADNYGGGSQFGGPGGSFDAVHDDIPMLSGSGTVEWSNWTDCTVQIPRDVTVASGSLIGVYDRTTLIDEFIVERQEWSLGEDQKPAWTLSGPQVNGLMGRIDIRPYDYPATNPSSIRDWIWDGDNALDNPDMEEFSTTSEKYKIDLDGATGGSFILTVDGNPTASILFSATAATVESELQGLATVTDVAVDKLTSGFNVEFIVPAALATNMTWTETLTGGGGEYELSVTTEGSDDQPVAWTTSQQFDGNTDIRFHGSYASDGFRLTTGAEPVFSGTYSLRVNGLTQYAGAQQIIDVIPGQTYQAALQLRTPNGADTFAFVIRAAGGPRDNEVLAQRTPRGFSVTPNTWTQFTIADVVIPEDVDKIIFRIACTTDGNPDPFYVDEARFTEGQGAATDGEIIRLLIEAAQLRDVADWLDLDFDDVNDTEGNAFVTHSLRLYPPQSVAHALDALNQQGTNWRVVRKATPVGDMTHDLQLYAKGSNPDLTGSVEILGVEAGRAIDRLPEANSRIAYGEGGIWRELVDASAVTTFGKWEGGYDVEHLLDGDEVHNFLLDIEDEEQSNRTALQATMYQNSAVVPLTDFLPGDQVLWQFPGIQTEVTKAVKTISWRQAEVASFEVTGSTVMDPETAMARAVEFLLDRVPPRPRIEHRRGTSDAANVPGSSGGMASVLVAASDASALSIGKADFRCDGLLDHIEILDAIALLPFEGGTVWLSEGEFHPDWDKIKVPNNVVLRGLNGGGGGSTTVIDMNDTNPITGTGPAIELTGVTGASVRDLSIWMPSNGLTSQIAVEITGGDQGLVEGVSIDGGGVARGIVMSGVNDRITIRNCTLWDCGGISIDDAGGGNNYVKIINNLIHLGEADGIYLESPFDGIVAGNHIVVDSGSGIWVDQPDGISIAYNQIEVSATTDAGIRVESTTGVSDRVVITGNLVEGSGTDGCLYLDRLTDVTVTGNYFRTTSGYAFQIGTNGSERWTVSGNVFWTSDSTASTHAIYFPSTGSLTRATFTGNFIRADGGWGMYLDTDLAFDIVIDANYFYACDDGGIYLDACQSVQITNNRFEDSPFFGTDPCIWLDGSGSTSHDCVVSNNVIEAANGVAILVDAYDDCTIEDNHIDRPARHGIQVSVGSDNLIEGNHIVDPGQDADDTYDGIILDGDSNRNDIWGNKIRGNATAFQPRYGINISAAACDDNSYLGNRTGPASDYAQTASYNDAGTGTINTWPGAATPQGDNLL